MTVKFSIRHHYKDFPIEITVQIGNMFDMSRELNHAIVWLQSARDTIDAMYEALAELNRPKKEQKQNET